MERHHNDALRHRVTLGNATIAPIVAANSVDAAEYHIVLLESTLLWLQSMAERRREKWKADK